MNEIEEMFLLQTIKEITKDVPEEELERLNINLEELNKKLNR